MQYFLHHIDEHLVEHSDDMGYTALHHAALSGFEDTVDVLLAAGADVNACSVEHGTPLHLAAIKERANVLDCLLKSRAGVHHLSKALGLPLHCAAFSGNRSIADALTRRGARLEASAKVSFPEMHRVSGISPKNAPNYYLQRPTEARVFECQPFIVALMMQSREIMEKCMDSIPCIEQEFQYHDDLDGPGLAEPARGLTATPLMLCAGSGLSFFCGELLRRGASRTKTNSFGWNAVTYAAYFGHAVCIETLLHGSGDDVRRSAHHCDKAGWTPLMYAAYVDEVTSVQELLRRQVSVDQPSKGPGNPTQAGCAFNFDSDRRWDWRRQQGLTALHIAAYKRHREVAQVLVSAGASRNTKTKTGVTPVDAAGSDRDILAFWPRPDFRATMESVRPRTGSTALPSFASHAPAPRSHSRSLVPWDRP